MSCLSIGKKNVKPGETVTVSLKVTNTGGERGNYVVELEIDGEIKTKDVSLNPDQTEEISFKTSEEEPGSYDISVGELSRSFEVVEPVSSPEFKVSNLTIQKDSLDLCFERRTNIVWFTTRKINKSTSWENKYKI